MNDTMLSRSGRSNPDGKLTRRLDVPVSETLEEAIIAMAAIAGMPKAEFARRLLERAMFGELAMVQRLRAQAGLGPWDEAPTNGGAA